MLVGDREVPATVVYYNPDIDVAVLAVDGLDAAAPALRPARRAPRQAGGGARLPAGRPVRRAGRPGSAAEQRLRSPDIYGDGTVIREVFSLRVAGPAGQLRRPAGRPPAGEVLGVVFAASVTDGDTGYALTADQVRRAAAARADQRPRRSTPAAAPEPRHRLDGADSQRASAAAAR